MILDRQIVTLDFRVGRIGNFGLNFLLQQLLGREASLLGFGFEKPLADEFFEGRTLHLIFLGAQFQQLRRKLRQQVLLINRLPADSGNQTVGVDMRRGLAERGERKGQGQAEMKQV